jgi:uroporphyrin-III C-methyltransferase
MAVAHLERISGELIKRGRDATTPVAVIQDGTTASQRVLISTLDLMAAQAAAYRITSPSVVVIGEVVRLREELAFAAQPRRAEVAA